MEKFGHIPASASVQGNAKVMEPLYYADDSVNQKLKAEYFQLTTEWLELESQNDLVNNDRSNEISDRMEEITQELGASREVVIVVRGGVASIGRNTDDTDTLVTIVDYDDEAEEPIVITQS